MTLFLYINKSWYSDSRSVRGIFYLQGNRVNQAACLLDFRWSFWNAFQTFQLQYSLGMQTPKLTEYVFSVQNMYVYCLGPTRRINKFLILIVRNLKVHRRSAFIFSRKHACFGRRTRVLLQNRQLLETVCKCEHLGPYT